MSWISEIKREIDWPLAVALLVLLPVGVMMVYSASGKESEMGFWWRQIIWIGISLVFLAVAFLVPGKYIYVFSYIIYTISMLTLILVLFKNSGTGLARRWLQIGLIRFQPSEFAKVAVIMALARYLSGRRSKWNAKHFLIPMAMVLAPMILVIREPDLGTSLVFGSVLFPMLYWSGMKFSDLLFILSPVVNVFCVIIWAVSGEYIPWAAFIVSFTLLAIISRLRLSNVIILILVNVAVGVGASYSWDRIHDYQQKRIIAFFNPGLDPTGTGYQIIQSKIAIGSGGAFGKGFLRGTQSRLDFLPAQHTDFIFSVLGEELGFIGCFSIIGLFLFLIWRGVRIASAVQSKFSSLMAVGLVSMILFHVFVNVGVTMGIMPVTGIPLPFISYGGSFMVINMLSMGLLLNVSAHRHEYY